MNEGVAETSNPLEHIYVQRLGLTDDPFVQNDEVSYFYEGGSRKQLLDKVVHFSRFSDQLVVLTGAMGSGTSTVLDEVFEQLQELMDCCDINAELEGSPEQILDALADQLQFQLPEPLNPESFIEALKSSSFLDVEPEPILLAVDQAHFLPIESLQMLSLVKQLAGEIVHVLLVGEYQVQELASLAGFDREQISVLELEPLSLVESGEYVLGLLSSFGYQGDQPLSNDQLAVLYEQSGGNFSEINRIAPVLLSAEQQAGKNRSRFAMPVLHVAAVVFLLAALLLSYFYQDSSDSVTTEPVAIINDGKQSTKQRIMRDVVLPENSSAEVDSKPDSSSKKINSDEHSKKFEIDDKTEQASSEVASLAGSAAEKVITDSTDQLNSSTINPAKVIIEEETETVDVKKDVVVKSEQRTTPPAVLETPKRIEAVKQKVTIKNSTEKQESKNAYVARELRLLEMSADNYMLQLFATYEEKNARELVKNYIGRFSLTYFESRYNNRPWFVVVAGPYENRSQAVSGINALPEALQRQKPWARSTESIQSDIRGR